MKEMIRLTEFFVNPNPAFISPMNIGPMPIADVANIGPMVNAPPFVSPIHHPPWFMDGTAILVLFILLVIVLRVCH